MVPPQEGQYHQGIALDGSYTIEWASARVPPTPPHWSRAFAAQAQAVAFFLGGEVDHIFCSLWPGALVRRYGGEGS